MKKVYSAVMSLVLALGLLAGTVSAAERFAALDGIPAEVMSASEMAEVEGKASLYDFASPTYGTASKATAMAPVGPVRINSEFTSPSAPYYGTSGPSPFVLNNPGLLGFSSQAQVYKVYGLTPPATHSYQPQPNLFVQYLQLRQVVSKLQLVVNTLSGIVAQRNK